MELELQPITEPGRRFVALCEEHGADFAIRADEHDRSGTFPAENVKAMQESGALAACVPVELGGGGLVSMRDLAVGVNRLARGDGSTAIAVNMHFGVTWVSARMWRQAQEAGEDESVAAIEPLLGAVGSGSLVTCVLATEAGTLAGAPLAELTPVEGGYALNGRKMFGTLSPVADLLLVMARLRRDGEDLMVFASVDRNSEGVDERDDWDALGMRASGSQSLVFTDCFVPEEFVFPGGPWARLSTTAIVNLYGATLGLVAVFLGIAEEAQRAVVELVTTRRKAPRNRLLAERSAIQRSVAENEIDLAACRALIDRTGVVADDWFATHAIDESELDEMHELFAHLQAAKMLVNRQAVAIVDRALTASGGAGYLTSSPLSRLYRDVRAGPFMQSYSPNEAYEYIGKVRLGLDPTLEG